MLAQIAVSQADIRALMQVFKDTSGIDQSETIEQLIAAGKEDAENWSKIVEMVSSFVKDASHQLAELSNKGSM